VVEGERLVAGIKASASQWRDKSTFPTATMIAKMISELLRFMVYSPSGLCRLLRIGLLTQHDVQASNEAEQHQQAVNYKHRGP
jgi:hypothetical protein